MQAANKERRLASPHLNHEAYKHEVNLANSVFIVIYIPEAITVRRRAVLGNQAQSQNVHTFKRRWIEGVKGVAATEGRGR